MAAAIESIDLIVKSRLPLHETHNSLGARMISFGTWEVPAYYSSILEEHKCVREKVGVFDISHMGQIFVTGKYARRDIDHWITNNLDKNLNDGKAIYSPMCNDAGGVIEDVIVYQMALDSYLIVVNAGNIEPDFEWMVAHKSADTKIENRSEEFCMFAVQGPKALGVVSEAMGIRAATLPRFHFCSLGNQRSPIWVMRTGYTGEDGCEIIVARESGESCWKSILQTGSREGICPVGFGARDTLRLEAAYRLHGHDMDVSTTPLEAGLGWAVDLNKPAFIGKESLVRQKIEGIKRKLIGFVMETRVVARTGYEIWADRKRVGHVTSGSYAPTLEQSIGLGYVDSTYAQCDGKLSIKIRSQDHPAKIVKIPFYKREFN